MKNLIKISFLFIAFLSMSMNVQAQKYGYVNSDEILAGMNEVKQMAPELESLQTQLQKKGQQMLHLKLALTYPPVISGLPIKEHFST